MWTLTDLFFPPRCVVCDSVLAMHEKGTCLRCGKRLQPIRAPFCMKCGKELPEDGMVYCEDCLLHAHVFDSCRAAFLYNEAMRKSIYRFKYNGRKEYAAYYASSMAEHLHDWIRCVSPSVMVPVPIHEKRMKQRGYNQAELIARALAPRLGIPVETRLLMRVAQTAKQKDLNASERENNLKKAFKTTQNDVKLDSVLLVDDIYTTGSTVDAASRCLKAAGVRKVYVLALSIGRNT